MSVCFSIGCRKCKKAVWIGQRDYIYTGDKKVMKKLKEFLYKHMDHDLVFTTSESLIEDDFVEDES